MSTLRLRLQWTLHLHLSSTTWRLRQSPAPVLEYIAPEPEGYAAPAPVVEYTAPAPTFTCTVGVADVRATLHCTVDDSQRHHFVAYQTTAEERLAQGVPKDMFKRAVSGVNTNMHKGRGLNMTLDAHSFELVHRENHRGPLS